MKKLLVLQHTEAEFLGLIEDHFEARRIGFQYIRPFVDDGWELKAFNPADGLVLLGGGPWGSAGVRDVPSLAGELDVCRRYLDANLPVLGFGLGAQILALAAGGSSLASDYEFNLMRLSRVEDNEQSAFLPADFSLVRYGRDVAVPPPEATILAKDAAGDPAVFQIGSNCFGFAGHPGAKSGLVEDLIMEFEEQPDDVIAQLGELRAAHPDIEASLHHIMIGLIQRTGWMK